MKQNSTVKAPEESTRRQVLAELELTYQQAYGHSFTESCVSAQVQAFKKYLVLLRESMKRKLRECRDHISKQLQQIDPITVLAKGLSLQCYKRIRLSIIQNSIAKVRTSTTPV